MMQQPDNVSCASTKVPCLSWVTICNVAHYF